MPTNDEERKTVKARNILDVAAEVITKPDQEGLIFIRNVINEEDAGAYRMILLSLDLLLKGLFTTRNERISGSSPLVGSFCSISRFDLTRHVRWMVYLCSHRSDEV